MRIAAPCVDSTLRKQTPIERLPPRPISLGDWLIRHAEGRTSGMTPVTVVEADVGLLESLACPAEGKETAGVEVGKNDQEDVEGQVDQRRYFLNFLNFHA